MHHKNGFLENSGQEDGTYQSIQPRDRILPTPSHRPEDSELIDLSVALRQRIYGSGEGNGYPKHYVRRGHPCDNCTESFSSKSSLREHMFEKHSY